MLIEIPIIYKASEDDDVVVQTSLMIKVKSIESVILTDMIENRCEINTSSGDVYTVNLSYEKMVKYWHDAIENCGRNKESLFIAKIKESWISLN
jgi:hypothetical protein